MGLQIVQKTATLFAAKKLIEDLEALLTSKGITIPERLVDLDNITMDNIILPAGLKKYCYTYSRIRTIACNAKYSRL